MQTVYVWAITWQNKVEGPPKILVSNSGASRKSIPSNFFFCLSKITSNCLLKESDIPCKEEPFTVFYTA